MSTKPNSRLPQDESEHMIAVKCPNGHVGHYDKRVLCREGRPVMRGERKPDTIWVTCHQCDAEMTIDVDCEPYQ